MEWINVNKELPKLNDEYLVVWDLKDNQHPVVTSMDFDLKRQCFIDPRGVVYPHNNPEILFWGELPEPPVIDKKDYFVVEQEKIISIDHMERLSYGQCVHGENLANCQICNP